MNNGFNGPSTALGFDHSAPSHSENKQREEYLAEIKITELASRLIAYYQELGMRKTDAIETATERYLSLDAGVYPRMWKYIDADMSLDEAILAAQREIIKAGDIEAQALENPGTTERKAKDSYLGASHAELMGTNVKTKGGGSKSGRTRSTPLKPVVGKCENGNHNAYAGVVVCQECGHEQRDRRGRKRMGDELRVVRSARVDVKTAAVFDQSEEIMGAWLDVCAKFIAAGGRVEDIVIPGTEEPSTNAA